MNKAAERLYNGLDKRKSHLCSDAGHVSHSGGDDACCERHRHGTSPQR